METQSITQSALFQVFLRLRPPHSTLVPNKCLSSPERILSVEEPSSPGTSPSYVTLIPPNDNRRRAVEKFAFTHIFKEEANQLDVFHGTGVLPLIEGALGIKEDEGRDGLLATLGVTGSGKTHTILGSRTQRGLIQLALDVLFRSISKNLLTTTNDNSLLASVAAADPSEAQVMSAQAFIDMMSNEPSSAPRVGSRAPTPVIARSSIPYYYTEQLFKGDSNFNSTTPRRNMLWTSIPSLPDISNVTAQFDPNAEYAILISMYEVYNDRIFDLLTPASPLKSSKDFRRRPLLYKNTEQSPYRKVVAGLRKVLCGTIKEALFTLETGLHERQVAGTGSNSVSSRSHGFFSVEIKKKIKHLSPVQWRGSSLTVVDLAGSERARDAKTQGSTLAEAGKINESLMYLGQCLQIQSDVANSSKPNLVPFRQCKLTELLFSNCFPNPNNNMPTSSTHRNPQKAIMIVMADPMGDFNATSQMLRYSALAREVTVPRIPSVTSTILTPVNTSRNFEPTRPVSGRKSPCESERETMEIAALEISRMSQEIDNLRSKLQIEIECRIAVEAQNEWLSSRMSELEAEIREECFQEMEEKMKTEMRRWKATWAMEEDFKDEHLDRKLEIYTRTVTAFASGQEDAEEKEIEGNKENTYCAKRDELVMENERLRKEVANLTREIQGISPTKGKRLPLRGSRALATTNDTEFQKYSADPTNGIEQDLDSSPIKKTRSSVSRKWAPTGDNIFM
ncbi:Kinesin-like motor protein 9 [Golovinomyces cichoracearum]|uniref:Kinesin-like protein n=1 Tax=Golovinomyces cichoracearum TaxID=62708 RepID=A0A420J823_9PEZI|nr:Kinesin-like motor protein 9 [Golovinomyces cichoracearum]